MSFSRVCGFQCSSRRKPSTADKDTNVYAFDVYAGETLNRKL